MGKNETIVVNGVTLKGKNTKMDVSSNVITILTLEVPATQRNELLELEKLFGMELIVTFASRQFIMSLKDKTKK